MKFKNHPHTSKNFSQRRDSKKPLPQKVFRKFSKPHLVKDFKQAPDERPLKVWKKGPSSKSALYVYGKNPVTEVNLVHPNAIKQVFVQSGTEDQYKGMFAKGMRLQPVHVSTLDKHSSGGIHQGIVIELHSFPYQSLDTVMGKTAGQKFATYMILDHVTDPQNFGTIIRTAAAFNCDAIIIEDKEQVPVNGTVIKASAGIAFRIPIVQVPSILTAIETLKQKQHCSIYGMDARGKSIADSTFVFDKKSAFVFGSEGSGMRDSIKEMLDHMVAIPMNKNVESLNVSAAAASVCFERTRQLQNIN